MSASEREASRADPADGREERSVSRSYPPSIVRSARRQFESFLLCCSGSSKTLAFSTSMPQWLARRSRIARAGSREGDSPSRSSSRVTLKLPILPAKPPSLPLALPSSESERALSTVLREVVAPYFGGRIGLPPRDARNADPCEDLDSDLLRFTVELLCDEMGGCEDEAGGGGGEVGGSGMVPLGLYSSPEPFSTCQRVAAVL